MDKNAYGISVMYSGNNKEEYKVFNACLSEKRKGFDWFENKEEKYREFLTEMEEKTGLKLNLKIKHDIQLVEITEEGYVEPTPDPMMTYSEDIVTYSNIKATHSLGLISDEELAESQDYMRSIYPSERMRMAKVGKPEWFDKFRGHR